MEKLIVTSSAFVNNAFIPKKYAGAGLDVNPPLEIKGIPSEAKSLVLIIDDPDAPMGLWTHWVVWDISTSGIIAENSAPGTEGLNSAGKTKYHGPSPPFGTHRYFFKVFALNSALGLAPGTPRKALENTMRGKVLAQGELIGLYKK